MILDSEVSDLVLSIENGYNSPEIINRLIHKLNYKITELSPTISKLKKINANLGDFYPYNDGFAQAFDPLTQPIELLETWFKYGFVVGENVASKDLCQNVLDKIHQILDSFKNGVSNTDFNNTPFVSRGFFELYHDNCLAQIRQNARLYVYHSLLWQNTKLWTSFDRLGFKPPAGESSIGLGLHVDQNPMVHHGFTTIQGVLSLADSPVENGNFVVVPGSSKYFERYSQFIKEGYRGEFVNLEQSELFDLLSPFKQAIPLKQGCIVSWDSRTTHANSSNSSDINRYVMYTSTGIAKKDKDLILIRKQAFESGLGENTRAAYLHASKKPRFTNSSYVNDIRTPENLNLLGELLYGFKEYKD